MKNGCFVKKIAKKVVFWIFYYTFVARENGCEIFMGSCNRFFFRQKDVTSKTEQLNKYSYVIKFLLLNEKTLYLFGGHGLDGRFCKLGAGSGL